MLQISPMAMNSVSTLQLKQSNGNFYNKMSEETDSVEVNKDLSFKGGKTANVERIGKKSLKSIVLPALLFLAGLVTSCEKESIRYIFDDGDMFFGNEPQPVIDEETGDTIGWTP